jgi:hypothetical protein
VVTVSPSLASKQVAGFLVEPQNQCSGGLLGLGLKTGGVRFSDLGLKITVTISWFGPQNQAGIGLLVAPQNRWREVGAVHASRSNRLLLVEASLARVSCLASRLAEVRRRVVHVAASRRLYWSQVEDGRVDATGCIGLCYP